MIFALFGSPSLVSLSLDFILSGVLREPPKETQGDLGIPIKVSRISALRVFLLFSLAAIAWIMSSGVYYCLLPRRS